MADTPLLLAVALVSMVTAVPAQNTWVVNQSGAGHFTNLCPAIAAAVPGDTIVIQGGGVFGPCNGAYIDVDRSLRIVADLPRPQLAPVRIQVPGVDLALAGVQVSSVECASATFHGEDLLIDRIVRFTNARGSLTDCRHLSVSPGPTSEQFVALEANSEVAFSGCDFAGSHAYSTWIGAFCVTIRPRPGLGLAFGSRAVVTNCVLRGGRGGGTCMTLAPDAPAVFVDSTSTAILTGSTLLLASAAPAVPAIDNRAPPGSVQVDVGMTLPGTPSAVTLLPVPGVAGHGARPGATLLLPLQTEAGRPAIVALALGSQAAVPVPQGLLWLDLAQTAVIALGVTDAAGLMPASLLVPMFAPRGVVLTAQGVALLGSGILTASTPSVLLVR